MQSAYREGHSTESALLHMQNDVLWSIDSKQCVFLVHLDLSVAIETVDHAILLRRLSDQFGVKDKAHQWVASFLNNHKALCCGSRGAVRGGGSGLHHPIGIRAWSWSLW